MWNREDDGVNIARTYMKYTFRKAWRHRKNNYIDLYKITDRKAKLHLYCDVQGCHRHAAYAIYESLRLLCERHAEVDV